MLVNLFYDYFLYFDHGLLAALLLTVGATGVMLGLISLAQIVLPAPSRLLEVVNSAIIAVPFIFLSTLAVIALSSFKEREILYLQNKGVIHQCERNGINVLVQNWINSSQLNGPDRSQILNVFGECEETRKNNLRRAAVAEKALRIQNALYSEPKIDDQ